jgi:hypothetical protein
MEKLFPENSEKILTTAVAEFVAIILSFDNSIVGFLFSASNKNTPFLIATIRAVLLGNAPGNALYL